jgi:hypothetical protein
LQHVIVLRRLAAVLLVVALSPYLIAPIYRFPAPAPFAGSGLWNPYQRLHGTWQLANLHAHGRAWSGLTNGRHADEEVVRAYKARGYAVGGVSNYHSIAAHAGVTTIPIYEHGYNIEKSHQLAIGAHAIEWLDFPLWQGLGHKQFILDRVHAKSDLVAIAHPNTAHTTDDLRFLTNYELMEVINGPFVFENLWDAALSSGHVVWALGNDDSHDVNDPSRTGVAWTMIDAPTSQTADVLSALEAGRSYAVAGRAGEHEPTETMVKDVRLEGATLTVSCEGPPAVFSFVGQNGQVRKVERHTRHAAYTLTASDSYIRTVIKTPTTVMYLNPIIRYDGVALPVPAARRRPVLTWVVRVLVTLFAAVAVRALWRSRTLEAEFA